jgi:multiple sugar transport system substrate-binding protein
MSTARIGVDRRTVVRGGLGGAALLAGAARRRAPRARAAQSGTELSFMNWDPITGTQLETALNAFQEQTGIVINVQPVPGEDEYTTKMRTLLASGGPPDVMRIDDDLVRGFAATGQLLDLTPYIEESGVAGEYIEGLFEFPIQQDGTHPAWVIGVQPRVVFYNVDHFNEAGVPLPPTTWTADGWTWDDFLAAAQALTVPDEQRWGALIYRDNAYEQTFSVNNGVPGGIYSPDGLQFTLADPAGAAAVRWVADLTCVHGVQPPWAELLQDDARQQLFAAGRVSMIFGPFALVSYFRNNVTDFTWDVAPVPAKVDQKQEGSLIVFCVPRDAQNPDAAWELLTFLGSPEGARIFAEGEFFIPANPDAAELIQPGEDPPQNVHLFAEAANFQSAVSPSQFQERAEQIYRPQLDLVYTCQAPAADVLAGVREQVEAALAGNA